MSSCEYQTCCNNFFEKFLPRIGIRTTGAFLQKLLKPPKTPNEWKVAIIRKHLPIGTMQQKLANGQSCCAANGKDATSLATVLICKTVKLQSPRQSSCSADENHPTTVCWQSQQQTLRSTNTLQFGSAEATPYAKNSHTKRRRGIVRLKNSQMSNVRQNCKVVHTSMKLGQHGDSNSRYNGPMEKQITKNNVTMYNIACNTPLERCATNILYSGTCNVSQLKSKIQFPVISSQLGNQLRSQNQFALTQNSSN